MGSPGDMGIAADGGLGNGIFYLLYAGLWSDSYALEACGGWGTMRVLLALTVANAACHCKTSAFMSRRERGDHLRICCSLPAKESAVMLCADGFCTTYP